MTRALENVKKLNPEAHLTYCAPTGIGEHGWVVHEWGKELSGFHEDPAAACEEAIKRIKGSQK